MHFSYLAHDFAFINGICPARKNATWRGLRIKQTLQTLAVLLYRGSQPYSYSVYIQNFFVKRSAPHEVDKQNLRLSSLV